MQALVSIIMGSTSDLPVMEAACKFFDSQEIPFEVLALSAHRTPDEVADYAKHAHERGVKVIIAGAGMAAHLPGVIAAMTPLPVIGVPIKSSLEGVDAALAIDESVDVAMLVDERPSVRHLRKPFLEARLVIGDARSESSLEQQVE